MKIFISSPRHRLSMCVVFVWHFNVPDNLMAIYFVPQKEIFEAKSRFDFVGVAYR